MGAVRGDVGQLTSHRGWRELYRDACCGRHADPHEDIGLAGANDALHEGNCELISEKKKRKEEEENRAGRARAGL